MKQKLAEFLRNLANKIYEEDEQDICAICHEPGADKMPHPEHWPGEYAPPSDSLVHIECEQEECERAFQTFRGRVGGDNGVREFLRSAHV